MLVNVEQQSASAINMHSQQSGFVDAAPAVNVAAPTLTIFALVFAFVFDLVVSSNQTIVQDYVVTS